MRALVLVLAVVAVLGCTVPDDYYPSYDIPDLGFETVVQLGDWMRTSIEYVSDLEAHGTHEYWQTPLETYTLRTGDCEDSTLLMMFLIVEELGGPEPEMVYGTVYDQPHAWLFWDGMYYESLSGRGITGGYEPHGRLSYRDALWRAETRHHASVR